MNRQTLKAAERRFSENTRWIAEATAQSLRKETSEKQQARIEKLLRPRNYAQFFDYYFGLQAKAPLSEAPSASFHCEAYRELLRRPYLRSLGYGSEVLLNRRKRTSGMPLH